MDLVSLALSCADAYRETGERHHWRKGRNSSRGYDALTVPSDAWDDRPHDRYLTLVTHHLSSAAEQLHACADRRAADNAAAAVTLARRVFVESSKASWLLDPGASWTQRAARAHLELYVNLDRFVRRLPKRIEPDYPNFRRRQWKQTRDQMREVIESLFGRRALAKKREDITLIGEPLLTAAQLEEQFDERVSAGGFDHAARAFTGAPEILIDPSVPLVLSLDTPVTVDERVSRVAMVVALQAWLPAFGAWVRYNEWELSTVHALEHELAALSDVNVRRV